MAKKRLSLIRHAKAEHPEMDQSDAERALADRGHEDAATLGKWLTENNSDLMHIYSSSAKRTRETFASLSEHFLSSVSFDDQLYLASPGEILNIIQQAPDEQNHIAILGHNPGLHQLAIMLLERSSLSEKAEDMLIEFPTCAMLILEFEQSSWAEIQPQSGRFKHYWTRHEAVSA